MKSPSKPLRNELARPFGDREGLALEFKRAGSGLPRNFFETVCAFLNMDGGLIVLGVEDDGRVSGVEPESVARIRMEIANQSNNPQKLDPPYLLFPHEEKIGDRRVIKVQVPASSQVHRTGGEVFLRSEDDREYTSAAPATLTVFRSKVVFRNPHVPHLQGRIDPKRFTPFPKNPTICRFMLQMGRYEQAGSGVYNVTKYLPIYTPGASPIFEEYADVFETTIPLTGSESEAGAQVTAQVSAHVGEQVTPEVTPEATPEVTPEVEKLLSVVRGAMTRGEIQAKLGLRDEKHFREKYKQAALKLGLIEMTIPDKPRSSLQRYRLTTHGAKWLEQHKKTQ